MIIRFTIRNLFKHPFLNLVKILGLSLALSGILLIVMFLKNELSYDSYHKQSDRIYRFTITNNNLLGGKHFARIYYAGFIPQLKDRFPEIESYVRMVPVRGNFIKYEDNYLEVNQAFQCDSTFLQVFDCKLKSGNADVILNDPGTVIISESFAKKTFGTDNPIGKVITLPAGQFYPENIDLTIKGIMEDFPHNSHFHPDFICSPVNKSSFNSWAWVYLLLKENADPKNIEEGFDEFFSELIGDTNNETKSEAYLQKITDIHIHSHKLREIEANGNMAVVYTLSIAAFILLIIALINYANLNIGMLGFSDKFLRVSKMMGSSNRINIKYFILESILVLIASILICSIIVHFVNIIIQKQVGINLLSGNVILTISVLAFFSILSLISGILPLMRQVITKIKLSLGYWNKNNTKQASISKSLLITQFTISIVLIIAVLVIFRQTHYAIKKGLGVSEDKLICFENLHTNIQRDFSLFKDELQKYQSIESVTALFEPPGGEANDMFPFELEDYIIDESQTGSDRIGVFPCDYDFPSAFKLEFIAGKDFSEQYTDNEGLGEYIINEAALRRFEYTNPEDIIGKEFKLIFNYDGIIIPKGKIIGVVKNFHLSSLKKEINPLVLFKRKGYWLSNFVVAYKDGKQQEAISDIKRVWQDMFPQYPFEYEHVDAMYKSVYKPELLQARLLMIFTAISLFICSMGILGLSLLTAQRRTKEIGIRKVNGARIIDLMALLNKDLLKWNLISIVIAIPLAFYGMSRWLENFAYKTALSWWIFASAGIIAIAISIITVSFISWKAAKSNPVEVLRYE